MNELSAVFGQVQELLSTGISVIPVRDKLEVRPDGATIGAKVAYTGWKKYQSVIITKEELWHSMEYWNTTAIAMICGKVSGNLEIIDIDSKYYPGIDATIFADIKQIYPDLFPRLRIHKTPSGGYHILYRVADGVVTGNMKLAVRHATEAELQVKPKNKTYNFIETRGEGGYALAPPSMGYSVHSGAQIPLITPLERDSLIALCKGYTEIAPTVKQPTVAKSFESIYSENPFEHFNSSSAAEDVLSEHGYILFNDSTNYRRWTRPGRDAAGVSVTFRKDFRLYYFFSTSTEFPSEKWIDPSTVLAILKFGDNNDNKKKLFRWLVSEGYGKYTEAHERKIVTGAATYKTGVPANLSDEAKQWVDEALQKATEMHPYGIFWAENEKGNTYISRERLYGVSEQMGYRLHLDEVVVISGYKISNVDTRQYFDSLRAYIKIEDADEYENIFNCLDEFIQKSGKHVIASLPLLDTKLLFTPTKTQGYKFYKNCYVEITADEAITHEYANIGNKLVWQHSIHDRAIELKSIADCKESMYFKFLQNAVGVSPYLLQCIGYYAHEYKDEENGYIIILTEECENPKDGGGSGKSLFCKLLKYITTFRSVPGSQVKYDTSLLQTWKGERVFCMGDLPKKFDYMFFKDLTDNDGVVKKLFKDERSVTISEMPKFIASTNYSFDVSDGGLKRRIRAIEFKSFFTLAGGVSEYFGKMFPTDWDDAEWQAYDCIMIAAIASYLKCRGKITVKDLTTTGWLKQYKQNYNELTHQFIQEYMPAWKDLLCVLPEKFNEHYAQFCKDNNVIAKNQLSAILMNRALSDYCEHFDISFDKAGKNQFDVRCRVFKSPDNMQPKEDETMPF